LPCSLPVDRDLDQDLVSQEAVLVREDQFDLALEPPDRKYSWPQPSAVVAEAYNHLEESLVVDERSAGSFGRYFRQASQTDGGAMDRSGDEPEAIEHVAGA
jgi:hypothetical protein